MSHFADIAWAVTRFTFGSALAFLHGYGKVFEGKVQGLAGTVANLGFPFPLFFAWVASITEFFGGLCVALGLFTRPAAAMCAGVMMVALYRHRADPPARMELALLYFVVMLLFVFVGGGRFSLDRVIRLRNPFVRGA